MTRFSEAERTAMRHAQRAHMMDRCRVYRFERWERDSRGTAQKVFSETVETACGLEMTRVSRGGIRDRFQAIEADAVLRVPYGGATIKPLDEVEVFERFGEAVDAPHRYEVVKFEFYGVSGAQILLKVVYT